MGDTFVWLWNNRHRIRQEQTLCSLLYLRMRHYLVNAYRATVNSPQYVDYISYQERLVAERNGNSVEYDEFLGIVNAAIGRLPDTQRQVVRLSRLEQMSNKEIAARLNLAEQTVKNQLSLGLKALRKELVRMGYGLLFLIFC